MADRPTPPLPPSSDLTPPGGEIIDRGGHRPWRTRWRQMCRYRLLIANEVFRANTLSGPPSRKLLIEADHLQDVLGLWAWTAMLIPESIAMRAREVDQCHLEEVRVFIKTTLHPDGRWGYRIDCIAEGHEDRECPREGIMLWVGADD